MSTPKKADVAKVLILHRELRAEIIVLNGCPLSGAPFRQMNVRVCGRNTPCPTASGQTHVWTALRRQA